MKSFIKSGWGFMLLIVLSVWLTACGSGGGGGSSHVTPEPSVFITGSIHNSASPSPKVSVYEAPSFKVNTSITMLPDVVSGERIIKERNKMIDEGIIRTGKDGKRIKE